MPALNTPAPQLSRLAAWALALTATFTMAVSYLDRQTLAVLGPTVKEQLHIDNQGYGWLISAFSIAYLVGAPIAGRLIDRIGARRGLLGAVLLWSAVAALHAIAPGFAVLFALRIALGLAESPSFPGAAQTVHRALPPAARARGMGILFTGSSFGAMIAPKLATWIAANYGFRAAFIGTALVGLCWVPLWLAVAFHGRARAVLDRRLDEDLPAASAFDDAPRSEASPAKAEARTGPFSLAIHPAVLRAALVVLATSPLINLYFNWSATFLVSDHHLLQAQVGDYLWFPPLLFDLGAVFFGHRASRARAEGALTIPRGLVVASALLMCAGLYIPLARTPLEFTLIAAVSLAGGGGLFSLATAEMMAQVPANRISAAGGITAAVQSLAYIVANPLIGLSVDRSKSYTPIFLVLSAWVIPGTIGWLLLKPAAAKPT
ncbi:MAG: MFS transporter [Minicystis sp.]